MLSVILVVGFLAVILLFSAALMKMAGRCSRAEEEAERKRWEEMTSRIKDTRP